MSARPSYPPRPRTSNSSQRIVRLKRSIEVFKQRKAAGDALPGQESPQSTNDQGGSFMSRLWHTQTDVAPEQIAVAGDLGCRGYGFGVRDTNGGRRPRIWGGRADWGALGLADRRPTREALTTQAAVNQHLSDYRALGQSFSNLRHCPLPPKYPAITQANVQS